MDHDVQQIENQTQINCPGYRRCVFVAGDNIHNWHDAIKDKPTITKKYLVYLADDNYYIAKYDVEQDEWLEYDSSVVITWMDLPNKPVF